jgi:hypothetical protein
MIAMKSAPPPDRLCSGMARQRQISPMTVTRTPDLRNRRRKPSPSALPDMVGPLFTVGDILPGAPSPRNPGRPEVLIRGGLACQHSGMTYETGRKTRADPSVVTSRDELADFVEVVLGDFRLGGGESEWENATLDRFLEGLAAFAGARVVDQADQEAPSWTLFAEMIAAATGYE